jgi:hypothetical protein
MSQRSSEPNLTDIESALAGLVPVPSRLDRDQLMFKAGVASARSAPVRRWVLPSVAAAFAIGLISESLVMAIRPGPRVIERVVVVREPAHAAPASAPSNTATLRPTPTDSLNDARSSEARFLAFSWPLTPEYLRIEDLVLRLGLDALPERAAPLLSRSDGAADSIDMKAQSAGELRRLELEKLDNFNPGGPS